MSIFVDDAMIPYRGMKMCHLISDNETELHDFAFKIGLKREWFHKDHYDVGVGKRSAAVRLGAQEVTTRWAAAFMLEKRRLAALSRKAQGV